MIIRRRKGDWVLLCCFSGMVSTLSKMCVGVLKKGKEGLSCCFGGGNRAWEIFLTYGTHCLKLARPYEATSFFTFSSNFKGSLDLAARRNH